MNYLGFLLVGIGVLFIFYAIKGGGAVQSAKAAAGTSTASSGPTTSTAATPPANQWSPGALISNLTNKKSVTKVA